MGEVDAFDAARMARSAWKPTSSLSAEAVTRAMRPLLDVAVVSLIENRIHETERCTRLLSETIAAR
jgi:hypothetical protein